MFKSNLVKFLTKRAAFYFLTLSAADIAFLGANKWLVLAGLVLGVVAGIGRFCRNEWMFWHISGKGTSKSIAAFTLNQLVLLPVIALIYYLSVWALYGFVAGILAIPIAIMINSITEAFGITKNNFE